MGNAPLVDHVGGKRSLPESSARADSQQLNRDRSRLLSEGEFFLAGNEGRLFPFAKDSFVCLNCASLGRSVLEEKRMPHADKQEGLSRSCGASEGATLF